MKIYNNNTVVWYTSYKSTKLTIQNKATFFWEKPLVIYDQQKKTRVYKITQIYINYIVTIVTKKYSLFTTIIKNIKTI